MSLSRRKESRVRSRGEVGLWLDDRTHIPAKICNVSVNGICLEAKTEIAPGTCARIDCHGLIGTGIVRHCAPHGSAFRLGLELEPVDPATVSQPPPAPATRRYCYDLGKVALGGLQPVSSIRARIAPGIHARDA